MINQVLTEDEILLNKNTFLGLLNSITREGADIEKLTRQLEKSDFFYAPASTKYHGSYPGGLCDHCLCVYHNLVSLVKNKHLENVISEESLIITALLHDMDKMNKYTTYEKNVPPDDNNPKWHKEECYKLRDDKTLVYGNHEENSEYIVRQFIPLTREESVAILHHMGGMSFDSSQQNIGDIFENYSLALLLWIADMLSTYIEKA